MHSRGECRHGHRWTRRVGLTGWIKSLKGFGAGWIQQRGWSITKTINPKKGSSLQNPPRQSTGAGGKQAHKHRDVEKMQLELGLDTWNAQGPTACSCLAELLLAVPRAVSVHQNPGFPPVAAHPWWNSSSGHRKTPWSCELSAAAAVQRWDQKEASRQNICSVDRQMFALAVLCCFSQELTDIHGISVPVTVEKR